ncbi:hypothetical protein [Vibrio campbellii]|uniref:hypothetical protein n=1 Tax=Vibrio campbellii TaxID=680 RepID=UPI0028526E73|nr:hypothetical protein [Vibrio campbellii]
MEVKSDSHSPIEIALNSTALKIVIIGKTIISLTLVIAAILAIYFGGHLLLSVASTSNEMLVEFGQFKITSSGLGVSIMASSLFFAFCAYLCRPKLVVAPVTKKKYSRVIRNAWHFYYALILVFKVVCGGRFDRKFFAIKKGGNNWETYGSNHIS